MGKNSTFVNLFLYDQPKPKQNFSRPESIGNKFQIVACNTKKTPELYPANFKNVYISLRPTA